MKFYYYYLWQSVSVTKSGEIGDREVQAKYRTIIDLWEKLLILLIDFVNAYIDSLSNGSLERINEACYTKTHDISFILESLTDELRQALIF